MRSIRSGISKINASLSRAFGVYIGWNWRLWDSSWVFGINASLMWETGGKNVEIETSEKSFYRPGTMKFAPRMASAGWGITFDLLYFLIFGAAAVVVVPNAPTCASNYDQHRSS